MRTSALFSAAFVLAAASAWADPFMREPTDLWDPEWSLHGTLINSPWTTPAPYQRNIRYTFDNGLDIWHPIYQGTDDAVLSPSDWVQADNITWFPDDAFIFFGAARRYGLVGIDNRQGTSRATGRIVFHVDNWDSPNEWKHIWQEYIVYSAGGTLSSYGLALPSGYEEPLGGGISVQVLADGHEIVNDPDMVWPNPPWEEIVLEIGVNAGWFFLIDEAHFATECVPEPATLTLVGLGLAAVLLRRRR